jgi:4'-phosphopantetheinyl transferase
MPAPIRIYLLRLDGDACETGVPPAWLGGDDAARHRRMLSPKRRAEFAAGRLLLRHAMAECHPGLVWRLAAPPDEAPRVISETGAKLAPVVSITHSAGIVGCAVSAGRRLGVDIEHRSARKRDLDGLGRATLHPLEQAALFSRPPSERLEAFLRCWTLKEALAKALGEGLSLPFREFAFDGARLASSPAQWSGRHERWAFAHPAAGEDAVLGVAWSEGGGAPELSVHAVTRQQLPELVAR